MAHSSKFLWRIIKLNYTFYFYVSSLPTYPACLPDPDTHIIPHEIQSLSLSNARDHERKCLKFYFYRFKFETSCDIKVVKDKSGLEKIN
jgi:hypothetical protein